MMRQLLKCSLIVVVVGMFFLPTFAQEAFNTYEKLKEGDWVKFKSEPTPRISSETEKRVTKIEGKKLTYELSVRTFMDGKPLGKPSKTTHTVNLSTAQEPLKDRSGEKPMVEDATLKVNGKELKCKVYTTPVTKTWRCEDVPFGLVKLEVNGKVALELVDWGSKE